ncbi:MAG: rhamnan synthesis F family protein [Turneriella sp.]
MLEIRQHLVNILIKSAIEALRILRIHKFFPKEPAVRSIVSSALLKPEKRRLCVFASYSPTDKVPEFVYYYLQQLRDLDFDIIFASTSDSLSQAALEELQTMCFRVILRENIGYDFGSWKAGLFYAGVDLNHYDLLLLANDSCYAPLFPLTNLLKRQDFDISAMTDSYEGKHHLMSYFVIYSRKVFLSPVFESIWTDVRMLPKKLKGLIVAVYEVGMSSQFRNAGVKLEAFFPAENILKATNLMQRKHKINPVHLLWKELIEIENFPMLKVDLFKRQFRKNNDNSWRDVIQQTQYPIELIIQHQEEGL